MTILTILQGIGAMSLPDQEIWIKDQAGSNFRFVSPIAGKHNLAVI